LNKQLITGVFGLALLTLLFRLPKLAPQACSQATFWLELTLFVLVYYLLTRQVAKLKQAEATCRDLYNNAPVAITP
jgi:hypothetical protein